MKLVLSNGVEIPLANIKVMDVTEKQRIVVTLDADDRQVDQELINDISQMIQYFFLPARAIVFFKGMKIEVVEAHDIH
ncbi:MAG TPA: hypothetical protein PKM65_20575 [Spirochaetota bacterium]|nr:hypothetical protein [Spirochaetota bacterium]